jgi:hypothetical protein
MKASSRRRWVTPVVVLIAALVVSAAAAWAMKATREMWQEQQQQQQQDQTTKTYVLYVHQGPVEAWWPAFVARYGDKLARGGVGAREADADGGAVPSRVQRYVRAVPDVLFVDTTGGDSLRVVSMRDVDFNASMTPDDVYAFVRMNGWGPNDAISTS